MTLKRAASGATSIAAVIAQLKDSVASIPA
jgi:hypothetical protein